jgi:hypothetical protein
MAVPPKQKTRRFQAVVQPQAQTLSIPGGLPRRRAGFPPASHVSLGTALGATSP